MRMIIAGLVVVGFLGAGGYYYVAHMNAAPATTYRMAAVKRGDLLSTIGATGTLEPEEVIDVGAQVMGRIKDFGIDFESEKRNTAIHLKSETSKKDGKQKAPGSDAGPKKTVIRRGDATDATAGLPSRAPNTAGQAGSGTPASTDKRPRIDYGSIVHEGTELAYIDDSKYSAQVKQAQASLDRAIADLEQLTAKADQAAAELRRADQLRTVQGISDPLNQRPIKAISDSDYDLAVANAKVAKANLEVGKAVVEQARAALTLAKTDLDYTIIKSPVEGVIVDRRVNVGQTVVAALNAPSIFLIAKDLKRMQVWASVNEADIGRIRQGMTVKFTVDAYPGETFEGRVIQTRLNAQMTQNVVTYTVVVETENADGRLLPYLTANLQFEVQHHRDVLRVPNAALRWKPRPEQTAPDVREKTASGRQGKGGGKDRALKSDGGADKSAEAKGPKSSEERGRLWVKDGDYVRPVEVKIGDTDGSLTEVSGPGVKDEMEVVVGEEVADQGDAGGENPFAPKIFKGGKRG